jgi:hypothetical protein
MTTPLMCPHAASSRSAVQEFAAAEAALRPPGGIGIMTAEVAPGELKLAAALLQANAGRPGSSGNYYS